jgi:NADH:ubiquinone oxidoreductase subunit 4 (subunit M)
VPLLVLILWIGVYPKPFTAVTEASVAQLIATVKAKTGTTVAAGLPAARP